MTEISNDAVTEATGRGWDAWFAVLDEAGATDLTHADIARLVHEEHGCSGWWSQAVTVAYERVRGMREKHEKPGGFEVGVSRTVAAGLEDAFAAWEDGARDAWLDDARFRVVKATPGKHLRGRWDGEEGEQLVSVYFTAKGDAKTSVQVQHGKLPDADAVETMRALWKDALGRMKGHLGA